MRMESGPDSGYTRTWSPSGEIEYAKLADGTRLRYLKAGSGPAALILLHTVRTQLDHFQLVIPKISRAFTVYAVDMLGMGWSEIRPGASYTEPALRRAIVEFAAMETVVEPSGRSLQRFAAVQRDAARVTPSSRARTTCRSPLNEDPPDERAVTLLQPSSEAPAKSWRPTALSRR